LTSEICPAGRPAICFRRSLLWAGPVMRCAGMILREYWLKSGTGSRASAARRRQAQIAAREPLLRPLPAQCPGHPLRPVPAAIAGHDALPACP
jgi:hypothetical protein